MHYLSKELLYVAAVHLSIQFTYVILALVLTITENVDLHHTEYQIEVKARLFIQSSNTGRYITYMFSHLHDIKQIQPSRIL